MIHKNCDGTLSEPGELTQDDNELMGKAESLLPKVREHMDRQAFNLAFDVIWSIVSDADVYISRQEPWKLKKTDPARMETVLYVLAETIRQIGILIKPVMPESGDKLLAQLAAQDQDFSDISANSRLQPGLVIEKPVGVFPRLELGEGEAE